MLLDRLGGSESPGAEISPLRSWLLVISSPVRLNDSSVCCEGWDSATPF